MTLLEILTKREHSWKSGKEYADVLEKVKNGEYDPNKVDDYGNNALHLAAWFGCEIELFKAILSKIKNVNAMNKDSLTALMIACDRHSPCRNDYNWYCKEKKRGKDSIKLPLKNSLQNTLDMVKSLIEHKDIDADIQSENDKYGQQTALMFAFKFYGYQSHNQYANEVKREMAKQILIELLKKSNCELFGGDDSRLYENVLGRTVLGFNALHFAVFYGCHTDVFDEILGKIKDVNQPTKDRKETALHLISMKEDDDRPDNVKYMLKKLLEHPKIKINEDDNGRTALYYAIRAQNLATITLLMENGIDYTKTYNKMSAMKMAFTIAQRTRDRLSIKILHYLFDYIEKQGCCANGSLQACRKLKF